MSFHYHCQVTKTAPADPPCGYDAKDSDPFCAGCAFAHPTACRVDKRSASTDSTRAAELAAALLETQRTWGNRWGIADG